MKAEQFRGFLFELDNLKNKVSLILKRVSDEKEDPKLDDYHKQTLEDVEAIISEVQPNIDEFSTKAENDEQLIEEIGEIIMNKNLTLEPLDTLCT